MIVESAPAGSGRQRDACMSDANHLNIHTAGYAFSGEVRCQTPLVRQEQLARTRHRFDRDSGENSSRDLLNDLFTECRFIARAEVSARTER